MTTISIETEEKLIEIFQTIDETKLKSNYDNILHEVLKAFNVKFTPNLSCNEPTNKHVFDEYIREKGVLYNNVKEVSIVSFMVNTLSKIYAKTSFPFDVVLTGLIEFRKRIKTELKYAIRHKYNHTLYKDIVDRLNLIQQNTKLFVNYFWGNIDKSIWISSEVNLKNYVNNTLKDIHEKMKAKYGNALLLTDYDTFYIDKYEYEKCELIENNNPIALSGYSVYTDDVPTLGITPSGDIIRIYSYVESFDCNGIIIIKKASV